MARRSVRQTTASAQPALELLPEVDGTLALTPTTASGTAMVPSSSTGIATQMGLPPLTKAQVHY
jgi:hypothetical protein